MELLKILQDRNNAVMLNFVLTQQQLGGPQIQLGRRQRQIGASGKKQPPWKLGEPRSEPAALDGAQRPRRKLEGPQKEGERDMN